MDLNYSSSSESEDEFKDNTEHLLQAKPHANTGALPKPPTLELKNYTKKLRESTDKKRTKRVLNENYKDISDVFGLSSKKPKIDATAENYDNLTNLFNNVTSRTEIESTHRKSKEVVDVEFDKKNDVDIKKFDVNEFYKANEKDIETGRLNAKSQAQGTRMAYHGAGSARTGLENVIRWNIVNKEKISYQNEVLKQNQKKKSQNKNS